MVTSPRYQWISYLSLLQVLEEIHLKVSSIHTEFREDIFKMCCDVQVFCPGEGEHDIAAVVCTDTQADLEPDLYQLVTSAYLEDKPLFTLQCAMEENCVASGAYIERNTNPYWQQASRRLLRFTTAISNSGNADFRPFIPKDAWQWHACHQVLNTHTISMSQINWVGDNFWSLEGG